jgi:NAD(P)H dehydrogenase (quinone)
MTALMTVFDFHVCAMTGLTLVEHVHNGGIVPGITAEAVDDILERVRAAADRAFAPAALGAAALV